MLYEYEIFTVTHRPVLPLRPDEPHEETLSARGEKKEVSVKHFHGDDPNRTFVLLLNGICRCGRRRVIQLIPNDPHRSYQGDYPCGAFDGYLIIVESTLE